MNVKMTLETIKYFPERKSVLILSDHGWGKSSVVKQAAQELSIETGKPYGFIDFRLAQCETADLIGMMRHAEEGSVTRSVFKAGKQIEETVLAKNVTIHDVAEWFPTDPDSCGILFLDELFLANRDLQNAVMELALDYRFHFKELPKGWRVVSASNDNLDIYPGTLPSPALMDRFFKVYFKPTVNEWLTMAPKWNVHKAVTDYIFKFTDQLFVKPASGIITPTPRGWVCFSDVINHLSSIDRDPLKDPEYLLHLAKGYLGDTVAVSFHNYVKEQFKVFSGEDFIDKLTPDLLAELAKLDVPAVSFYNKLVIKYVAGLKKLSKKQKDNCYKYLTIIPKECAAGFWADLSKENRPMAVDFYDVPGVKDYLKSVIMKPTA